MEKLRVSLIQMEVTQNRDQNLEKAIQLIKKAGENEPDLIILPENFHFMGKKEELFQQAETLDGPTLSSLRKLAKSMGVYIAAGTMKLKKPGEEKLRNTCCVINPLGEIQDTYQKIHAFHANLGQRRYVGSEIEKGGDEVVVTSIKGVLVGLSVCFDMRFPELYRSLTLQGARIILVPSLFMLQTGKDHWEVLLRARAIENQVYIVAPATCGPFPPNGDWSYGRSMVVDPWGTVIAQAQDFETVITVDLDLPWIEEVRKRVPTLSHRRPEVYGLS
ncbi:MAG TPA: hydrolase [Paenibacillaceae bacterium]|nr:hydrolase [Paenibacillaceae bacterium]